MKSRDIQFWTLLVASCIVFLLYVGEIVASREIIKEQHVLNEQSQTAGVGPYYKDAWQKLAVEVWKGGAQDPALLELLKSEGIGVHEGAPSTGTSPATNAAPATPAPASPQPAAESPATH